MSVTWKHKSNFKPKAVLDKIALIRTENPTGGASFAGFELDTYVATLLSMLDVSSVASKLDVPNIIWVALAKHRGELTPCSFLQAVNSEVRNKLATKEQIYFLLTSLSIDHRNIPKHLSHSGAEMTFTGTNYPTLFKSRTELLRSLTLSVPSEVPTYCRVVVKVKSRTALGAFHLALRALDLQRSIWCLMGNPGLEISIGGAHQWKPINVVRLGSRHTVHFENGDLVDDHLWIEAGFTESKIFSPNKPDVLKSNSQWINRRIKACAYGDKIELALLRFVRALDEADANTAFLRLWGALESLVTTGKADYDQLIKRCSFFFRDEYVDYHTQVLEHLREYRNVSVHAGEASDNARIHCFQIQGYFVKLVLFHLTNTSLFESLDHANEFLDLPRNKDSLKRRLKIIQKALKFRE